MCEIREVNEYHRPYEIPYHPGQYTTVCFTVGIGSILKKNIKLDVVSNSKFTQKEFEHYKNTLKNSLLSYQSKHSSNGMVLSYLNSHVLIHTLMSLGSAPSSLLYAAKLLSKLQIHNRRDGMKQAMQHNYTDGEIKNMVQQKQGLNNALVTEYHSALESLYKKRNIVISLQQGISSWHSYEQRLLITRYLYSCFIGHNENLDNVILLSSLGVTEHDVLTGHGDEEEKLKKLDKAFNQIQSTINKLENDVQIQKELFEKCTQKFTSLNKRNREANFKKDVEASIKKKQLAEAAAQVTALYSGDGNGNGKFLSLSLLRSSSIVYCIV